MMDEPGGTEAEGTEPKGTEASRQLLGMARELTAIYVAELAPRAALVTGSAAEGLSDHWSDLDLIIYHDQLPTEAAIKRATQRAGGRDPQELFPWDGEHFAQSYRLRGVECQVGQATVAAVQRQVDEVLVDLDVETPFQKALDGLLHAVPLHGDDLVRGWQARLADYPDPLRRAMVERYLRFFPLWLEAERMAARDATLFRQQMLVEASLHLLAVLAAINRVYFSTFQFKRMATFANRLHRKPPALAARLERLFATPETAAPELEALVSETVGIVERELPDIDTSRARRWLGRRAGPWSLSPSPPGSPAAPGPPGP